MQVMFEHSDAYEEPNDSSDYQYIGSNHHGYENVLTIRNEKSVYNAYFISWCTGTHISAMIVLPVAL